MSTLVTVEDFHERARSVLPRSVYDYYAGGAGDEWTLRENRAAFDRLALLPRVLVDVSAVSLATTVLDQQVSMPVLAAPTALHRMAHPDGELATARACREAGTLMTLSTLASASIEDVGSAGGARWFQLYVMEDRGRTEELVRRAAAAGYSALVLTVDLPVLGIRDRDERNSFAVPEGIGFANLAAQPQESVADGDGSELFDFVLHRHDRSLDWDDLGWIRSLAPMPLVLKGVVAPADVRLAVEAGVDAIVVSNHGGRQLDGTIPAIEALPGAVDAADGAIEVYVDGGVRRGIDVLKALALGARAVFVGRPILWGLAVDGQAGVQRVLEILRLELEIAMAIAGCRSVADIRPSLVRVLA